MKLAQVYGDMSSDKSSDNYPIIVLCDKCFDEREIIIEENWTINRGDRCEDCGKSLEDERKEKNYRQSSPMSEWL